MAPGLKILTESSGFPPRNIRQKHQLIIIITLALLLESLLAVQYVIDISLIYFFPINKESGALSNLMLSMEGDYQVLYTGWFQRIPKGRTHDDFYHVMSSSNPH